LPRNQTVCALARERLGTLPSLSWMHLDVGAGNGTRTRDPLLGNDLAPKNEGSPWAREFYQMFAAVPKACRAESRRR